ncbi:hypothetical protein GCM10010276_84460 [Streptomyces longisporus]|uniref:Uncharacterized protein n=1 Tax=Streptomyces longisporus TaxID=1948 RepID=A0ABN3NFS1_STRLO
MPYSPSGRDGEGDAAKAGTAAPSTTVVAASTAALRRTTFMIGGCLSLRERAARDDPGGSAPYASTVPRADGCRRT